MEFDSINYPITFDTNQDIQENELKDICDKAFKRNSIYPLMEIPKLDIKDIIEEQYKTQAEIFPGWSDIDRIDHSKIWK